MGLVTKEEVIARISDPWDRYRELSRTIRKLESFKTEEEREARGEKRRAEAIKEAEDIHARTCEWATQKQAAEATKWLEQTRAYWNAKRPLVIFWEYLGTCHDICGIQASRIARRAAKWVAAGKPVGEGSG